ncbi:MAG: hypothetical protein SNJ62_04710, partial [Chloracidobacterium sp.]
MFRHAGDIGWRMLEAGWDTAWLLLAPQRCRCCGDLVERYRDGVVCQSCWERWLTEQKQRPMICERCGRWADATVTVGMARRECEQCAPWVLTWARSAGAYTGALRVTLLALKRAPPLPVPLRRLLQQIWQHESLLHTSDLIVPIPLAQERQARRGYNQAELLAREVARAAQRPLVLGVVERVRETIPHRAGLDEQARRAGLKGAFCVARPRLVRNRRV